MKFFHLIGTAVVLISLTTSVAESQTQPNSSAVSTTPITLTFMPRPLPRPTKDNLAKWGLTEEIWLHGTGVDFAAASPANQAELNLAAQSGGDAVALVLASTHNRAIVDAASGAKTNEVWDATSSATNSIEAAAGAAVDAVIEDPIRTANLRKAAALGDPRAQWMLGEQLIYSSKQSEITEGQMMYRLAAEGGVTPAMYGLAFRLGIGFGFEENKLLAEVWARRCADFGSIACMKLYAQSADEGWIGSKRPAVATLWYMRAAEAGDSDSMVILGYSYRGGEGASRNLRTAVSWFRKAAEAGNSDGMMELGRALKDGQGIERNEPAAVGWFRRAAAAENSRAMVLLGIALVQGRGVSTNKAAGLGWFKRAAEAQNVEGMYLLAVFLETGIEGRSPNKEEAAYWYTEALATDELNEEMRAAASDALVALEGVGIKPKAPAN